MLRGPLLLDMLCACARLRVTCFFSAPVHPAILISSSIYPPPPPPLSLSLSLPLPLVHQEAPTSPDITGKKKKKKCVGGAGNGVLPLLLHVKAFIRETLFFPHPAAQSCTPHLPQTP